jgi:hypothetical protein
MYSWPSCFELECSDHHTGLNSRSDRPPNSVNAWRKLIMLSFIDSVTGFTIYSRPIAYTVDSSPDAWIAIYDGIPLIQNIEILETESKCVCAQFGYGPCPGALNPPGRFIPNPNYSAQGACDCWQGCIAAITRLRITFNPGWENIMTLAFFWPGYFFTPMGTLFNFGPIFNVSVLDYVDYGVIYTGYYENSRCKSFCMSASSIAACFQSSSSSLYYISSG